MKSKPEISIIIPCYNQSEFLRESVGSVTRQSFQDFEIIIVNDGSTDQTQHVAEELAHSDSRINVCAKTNGGLSSARNSGLALAKGNFIQFLDADDLILPDLYLHVIRHFLEHPEVDMAQVGYRYVNETNNEILSEIVPPRRTKLIPDVLMNNIGPCHSFIVKRELVERIGKFDEALRSGEDWDYWIRAGKLCACLGTIRQVGVAYRYVTNSMSRDAFRMYDALKTVAVRAPQQDVRITEDSPCNKNYTLKLSDTLKRHLLTCLGVSVMQGKIRESVELFNKEIADYAIKLKSTDFQFMYSYLSFRYWNSRKEVELIFKDLYPRFKSFFNEVGLDTHEQSGALHEIFKIPRKLQNRYRYGRLIGGILNKLQRY